MFLHCFRYELTTAVREKSVLFWLVIFPAVLALLMNAAFSSIYDKTSKFSTIPVAVVENSTDLLFRSVMDAFEDNEEPLLKATYTTEEEALGMLERKEVKGIIYTGRTLTLSLADTGVEETVLRTFTDQYVVSSAVISDLIKQDPAMAQKAGEAMSAELDICREEPLTKGNTDPFVQYFYNLIAMVAIYGSILGLQISINNQADLSPLAARKACSPVSKTVGVAASLAAAWLVESVCIVLFVTFVRFVLGVELGGDLRLIYLSSILGGMAGVSIGFFIGSSNRFSNEVKFGVSMAVNMTLCFFSGLMASSIKLVIEEKAPWFNRINPPAVISNSLYYLNVDDDLHRYAPAIAALAAMTLLFSVAGAVFSRRKRYASL
ncbi:MAG: ABC transporter permease [Ruminococcus sp.]|nr:ABC transporter permease [Ruminococcus sp.]